jgi:hypothetical protein
METLAYYRDQSPVTDPGEMARHLADLPHDLAGLDKLVAAGLLRARPRRRRIEGGAPPQGL